MIALKSSSSIQTDNKEHAIIWCFVKPVIVCPVKIEMRLEKRHTAGIFLGDEGLVFDLDTVKRYPIASLVERWPSGRRRSPAKGV